VKRYIRYWDKRVEIFGETRAYRPITLDTFVTSDDRKPLEIGALQVIHRPKTNTTSNTDVAAPSASASSSCSDVDERDMLWVDVSKLEPTHYSREAGIRAFWYFFHALLEDEQVQRRGLIVVNYSAHYTSKNRDPTFTRMCVSSLQGCIPIRLSAFHGCHPPTLYRLAASIFLLLIGDRLRKRVLPHAGTNEHVIAILERKYHIPRDLIPVDMGGNLTLDVQGWLAQRQASGL
jgi:CRAL/TRIO domain